MTHRTAVPGKLGIPARREVERFQLHQGLRTIWRLMDAASAFVSRREPWKRARDGDEVSLQEELDDLPTVLESLASVLDRTGQAEVPSGRSYVIVGGRSPPW